MGFPLIKLMPWFCFVVVQKYENYLEFGFRFKILGCETKQFSFNLPFWRGLIKNNLVRFLHNASCKTAVFIYRSSTRFIKVFKASFLSVPFSPFYGLQPYMFEINSPITSNSSSFKDGISVRTSIVSI
jgi:hypothetical protein